MATDERRRKVATELRELAANRHYVDEFIAADTVGFYRGEAVEGFDSDSLLEVADLIDRPTCHDATDNFCEFVCSKCGCSLDISNDFEPTLWVDGKATVPSYCPNCGAEVLDD